jgi:RNA polymerase sigma-70 factor (ECF subfamily)
MNLVAAAREGNESAFLQLFVEHQTPLFRFAWRLTGSVADAQDIVQQCFLELLRPSCSYDERRTPIRTYLFGVVRNQALKRLRERETQAEERHRPVSETRSPESEALQGELARIVAEAVRQLPETQREVLVLAHYEQLPLAEIARVLSLELTAVKSRLQRARAGLKETLAAYAAGLERKS